LDINNKSETVRLIGVDTPETKDPRKPVQCFGKEASEFTSQKLLGKQVRLGGDATQQERDKYGRLLRYVYLPDGILFNRQLIAQGYAYEYTYKIPYRYQIDFKANQASAQKSALGLWNSTTCSGKR
jgi:micrococcal nuclease